MIMIAIERAMEYFSMQLHPCLSWDYEDGRRVLVLSFPFVPRSYQIVYRDRI